VSGLARFLLIIAAGVRDFGVAFLEFAEARQGRAARRGRALPVACGEVLASRQALQPKLCGDWNLRLPQRSKRPRQSTNLNIIVASPADLVSSRPFSRIDAVPAVIAVERYLTPRRGSLCRPKLCKARA
jgi:hypothetical protein